MTLAARAGDVQFGSLMASALWSGQRRLDSENYLSGGFGLRLQLERTFTCRPMSDVAEVWQPPRLAGVTVAPPFGIPFFTATQAFDLRPVPRKFLAPKRTPALESRYVEPGWILVTCSGSVGDAIIAYRPHEGVVVSHDLLRVIARDPRMRGYLYGLLKSSVGRQMLRSSRYGSIVNHLEPEHLHDVPVPEVPEQLLDDCEAATTTLFGLRQDAYDLSVAAEAEYATAIGEDGEAMPNSWHWAERASSMWGSGRSRLDAYFHNPTAAAVAARLRRHGETEPLAGVADRVFGVPRFKHVYLGHGVPYLDSEDLFKVNPELTKLIPSVSEKARTTYFVQRGWVLMACSGQLYGLNGSAVLAGPWHENKIISNHVNRIVPGKGIRPGYLQMAVGHPTLGRPLALRFAFGSSVPEIAAEDLGSFPIARLGDAQELSIARRVDEASRLRHEADQIEDSLARTVDSYITGQVAAKALAS